MNLGLTYPRSTPARGAQIPTIDHTLQLVRQLADDVFSPTAYGVDLADVVPASHFDRIGKVGLYGLTVPDESGGVFGSRPAKASLIGLFLGRSR